MTEVPPDFASLLNTGIVAGNIESKAESQDITHESVVILGSARGGTSMISGALYHMGLFMGEGAKAPVYEDTILSQALEKRDEKEVRRLVGLYSSQYALWGFKRPLALFHLCEIESIFPAPKYVIVFKDILSIANRNRISMRMDVLAGLDRALSDYGRLISFLHKTTRPYILVSYDKVLSNPDKFIDALAAFLRLNPGKEQRAQAIEFISPNPQEYIDRSRITKAVGRLDRVERVRVGGWAKYYHSVGKPATVALFINGKETKRTIANLYRQDLKEKGIHPSGHCAFCFDLTDAPIKPNDEVRVRVVGEIRDLNNSPASPACNGAKKE